MRVTSCRGCAFDIISELTSRRLRPETETFETSFRVYPDRAAGGAACFEAGLVSSVSRSNNVARITYGSFTNWTFTVEATTNLLATNSWTAIGAARNGDDFFQTQQETNNTNEMRFYRVRTQPAVF